MLRLTKRADYGMMAMRYLAGPPYNSETLGKNELVSIVH